MLTQTAVQYATANLGGKIADDFDAVQLVSRAAVFMESMREWRYLQREAQNLQLRAPIDATGVTYVASSQTVNKSGAFAAYTLVPGDTVKLTNSGTLLGTYKIVSKTDSDTIVIDSPGLTPDLVGTLTIHLNTSRIALPSDVGRIQHVWRVEPQGGSQWAASRSELTELDASYETGSDYTIGYAVAWEQLTATSVPVMTLRVWPEPDSNEADSVTVNYLREWPTLSGSEEVLPIPRYMEALFLEVVRAMANAYDEDILLDQNLAALEDGPTYDAACRFEMGQQRYTGKQSNNALMPRRRVRDEGSEFVLRHIIS